jgi:hypothetical protein
MADHRPDTHQDPHVTAERPDQFDREISWKAIGWSMLIIAVLTAGSFFTMWYLGVGFRDRMAESDAPAPLVAESRDELLPPEPRLQTTSYDDWAEMKAEHEEFLSTYAWTDRSRGKVRIPVEEAMRRIAEEGLPDFPAPPGASAPGSESTESGPVESN